jgi:hypothetical protein
MCFSQPRHGDGPQAVQRPEGGSGWTGAALSPAPSVLGRPLRHVGPDTIPPADLLQLCQYAIVV